MPLFKAYIRVVKSIAARDEYFSSGFDTVNVITEPIIEGINKADVKRKLSEMYPQFFQNGKVYEKETKDQAQFFYVLIYPILEYEIKLIEEGEWQCAHCGQVYENKYIERPYINERVTGIDKLFCKNFDNNDIESCYHSYKKQLNDGVELPDDDCYIKKDSPNYIYKITEKTTGKCYIGKTRNAPFFRWWNHLTKSSSPFGKYLSGTKLSEWLFEVLEELPADSKDIDVFAVESKYIIEFDSINNGYNTLISNKAMLPAEIENKEQLRIDL